MFFLILKSKHLASSTITKKVESFNSEKIFVAERIVVIDYGDISQEDENSYAIILEYILRQAHAHVLNSDLNIVEMIDEAHRVFNNTSRRASALVKSFTKFAREGRVKGHWMIVSTQLFSDIDPEVRENLNTRFVLRQNTREASKIATENMGSDFIDSVLSLGKGKCLVKTNESQAVLQVAIAPSPFELMRKDNRDEKGFYKEPKNINNDEQENKQLNTVSEETTIYIDNNENQHNDPEYKKINTFNAEESIFFNRGSREINLKDDDDDIPF